MVATDEELVARSMAGDAESFNQLVLRWERPIYALAYRVIGHQDPRTALARLRLVGQAGRGRAVATRALGVEPGINVTLAEPPLAAHADRGDLTGLNQSINRAEVDLEVLQDFFGGEKDFVVWKVHAH